jgi:uncharacterized membrane protein YeaQ/YmgE (transglycosylase-associated protein family)
LVALGADAPLGPRGALHLLVKPLAGGFRVWLSNSPTQQKVASIAWGRSVGTQTGRTNMNDAEIGWIAAIIIGGLAGWLAEMFMKSGTGMLTNIVLGIVGAAVANFLLGFFGVALGGWLGYLIAGFVGACVLIFAWRAIKGRT